MIQRSAPVSLEAFLNQGAPLPVCPAVFVRLTVAISPTRGTNTNELADILSSDPALAGQVLKVSNSALYGHARQVRSINEAILRIGIREIWVIASALQAKSVYGGGGAWSQLNHLIWEHSVRTAALTRVITDRLKISQADESFTTALLHDLGKSVLLGIEPQYRFLCRSGLLSGEDLTRIESDFFGTDHATLGGELLRHWNFPASMSEVVARHHGSASGDELSRVLALANQLAHAMEQDCDTTEEPVPEELATAVSRGLLDSANLNLRDCAGIVKDSRRHFQLLVGE